MLTSRNIHFAILGIIIGASAGYIFAFYQAEAARPATTVPQSAEQLPPNHPSTDDAGVEELRKQVDANPNDSDLLARYGTRLFTLGQIDEAIATYEKVLQLKPDNLTVRSLIVAMLFSQGKLDEARKHLDIALKQNPNHIPTLHGYFLVTLEGDKDLKKAGEILKQIEVQSPDYQGLADLKARMEEVRKAQP